MRPGAYQMFWAASRTVIRKQHRMLANFLQRCFAPGVGAQSAWRMRPGAYHRFWAASRTVIRKQHRMLAIFLQGLTGPDSRKFSVSILRLFVKSIWKIGNKRIGRTSSTYVFANIITKSEICRTVPVFYCLAILLCPLPPPPPTASPPTMSTLRAANKPRFIDSG